jgi:hypothetical protein
MDECDEIKQFLEDENYKICLQECDCDPAQEILFLTQK